MQYNSQKDNKPYRIVRFTISNPYLMDILKEIEKETGKEVNEIAFDALAEKIEREYR